MTNRRAKTIAASARKKALPIWIFASLGRAFQFLESFIASRSE
jgi:hypothetical protein